MALTTLKVPLNKNEAVGRLDRDSDVSGANAQVIVTTPVGAPRRLIGAFAVYSAAPTQTGVIIEIDSRLGAGGDFPLLTGTANARYTSYIPTDDLILPDDDAIRVTAPAGGVGITSTVYILTEVM